MGVVANGVRVAHTGGGGAERTSEPQGHGRRTGDVGDTQTECAGARNLIGPVRTAASFLPGSQMRQTWMIAQHWPTPEGGGAVGDTLERPAHRGSLPAVGRVETAW